VETNRQDSGSQLEERGKKDRDWILLFLFFLSLLFVVVITIIQLISQKTLSDELPIAIHSYSEADYSYHGLSHPNIDLSIIKDILLDLDLDENEIEDRLATLTAIYKTPVPTSTGTVHSYTSPTQNQTPSATCTPTLTITSTPTPTVTIYPIQTSTPTSTSTSHLLKPAIEVVKSLGSYDDHDGSGTITLGDGLWYQFSVSNIGNTSLSYITVTDETYNIPVNCPAATLSPGEEMICSTNSPHHVTLWDANAGQIYNAVTAAGDYGGKRYIDMHYIVTSVAQNPAIQAIKSLAGYDDNDLSGTLTPNDGLWYHFEITNIGNVSLNYVQVVDNTFAIPVHCPVTSLIPGEKTNCVANTAHILTLDEFNTGQLINNATASAVSGTITVFDSDELTIPLGLDFTIGLRTYDDNDFSGSITIDDDLWYQYDISNIGTMPLNNISVSDISFGIPISCPSSELVSGESMTCTADLPHNITLAEADRGYVRHTIHATGQLFSGVMLSTTESLDTPVTQDPSLTISKSAQTSTYNTIGQIINYTFIVTNSGNVTLTGPFVVDDDKTNNEICPIGDLAPNDSLTCTASYAITLADLNNGTVTNRASVSGMDPNGITVTSKTTSATITAVQNPEIQISTALQSYSDHDHSSSITLGDDLWFEFVLTNLGNVTLDPIGVSDDSFGIAVVCPQTSLDPGTTIVCTASNPHKVNLAESNLGEVSITATATGSLAAVTFTDSDTLVIGINQAPSISLTKSLQGYYDNDLSSTISWKDDLVYQFVVLNDGNVTLSNIRITDNTFTIPVNCPVSSLDPGNNAICTSTGAHTITLAEALAGQVVNTAVARGDFSSIAYQDNDTLITYVTHPSYTISKSVTDVGGDGPLGSANQAGEVITYEIVLYNDGNVNLTGVSVIDSLIASLSGPTESGNPDGILEIGETWIYAGTYSVLQSDIDSNGGGDGDIDNIVEATTTELPLPKTATVSVQVDHMPSLSIQKSSTIASLSAPATVTYDYLVTNTGNVTLTGISLSDDNDNDDMTCPSTTLAVGANMSCTATHTFTQAELDAGGNLSNNVIASSNEAPDALDNLSIPITQTPAMTVDKNSVTTGLSAPATVTYDYLVTNTGNVTLTGIGLSDDNDNDDMTCPSTTLAVGANMSCTATHTFTQTELDAGGNLSNNVIASSNEAPDASDNLSIPITQTPAIQLGKNGVLIDESGDDFAQAGETISYNFTVTNIGNVTLTNISLSDPGISLSGGPIASLAPGVSDIVTFTGVYSLTQADVEAGIFDNTATVTGTPPIGSDVTGIGSDSVSLPQNPAIRIVNSLSSYDDNDTSWSISRGDNLWYQFEITNMGNVTLTNVSVTDETFAIPVTCPSTTLALDESVMCSADSSHTVTIDEANAGQVSNTAMVSGEFNSIFYTDSDTLSTIIYPIESSVVSGQVRDDSDGDGNLDDKDAGLANVKIELDDGICTLGVNCSSTLTNENGVFTFASVANGSYLIVENDLADYNSTADSDPPNDNRIDVIISDSTSSTGNIFLDTADSGLCTPPDLINGFVLSTNPNNGDTGVPLTTTTITVTFNQPMITSGAESVTKLDQYELKNKGYGKTVTISSVTYDPVTRTATLTIDTNDPDWQAGTLFELKIKNIKNACGSAQVDVVHSFTTEIEISGEVRNDQDSKGIYGVTVTLTGGSCSSGCITTTDQDGHFRFLGVTPGVYTLDQTDLPGYTSISDSDGGDVNQISLTLLADTNSTDHYFVDTPATCTAPEVFSSDPADGQTGVLLSDNTLTVTFNQSMITYDGGSVLDKGNFDNNIDNQTLGGDVPILEVLYDPNTYTATLTIDTSDPQWQPGSQFRLRIKSGLENPCGVKLGSDVDIFFTTEAYIAGQVLNSLDGKGIYGAQVVLTGGSCPGGCNAITDLNGDFNFSGLSVGNYTLTETNLPGYSGQDDSAPPPDDQIPLTLAGSNSTGHVFTDTPTCAGGVSFVSSTDPANGATGVSLNTSTLMLVFNQPMMTEGGGSVLDKGNFDNNIDNLTLGGDVPILSVSYDPTTYTASLIIDTSDPQWKPGSQFRLRIKDSIKNACDGKPTANQDIFFTTDLIISGQVRRDTDGDGSLLDPDHGLSGVMVWLYDSTGFIILDSTITDSGGYFTFDHLSPGTYIIREIDPSDYDSTYDTDPPNDNRITVILAAGTNSIGHKFLDTPDD